VGVLPPGTPVELRRGDAWSNGWVIANATKMDSIRAAKLGSPHITISSLRWELDVRLCQSGSQEPEQAEPVSAEPQTTELFDF
jgi:Iap family predicted aminopeptidase